MYTYFLPQHHHHIITNFGPLYLFPNTTSSHFSDHCFKPYIKRNKDLPRVGRTKAVGETKANGGTKGVGDKNALGKAADASATPTKEHYPTADKPRSSDRIAAKKNANRKR